MSDWGIHCVRAVVLKSVDSMEFNVNVNPGSNICYIRSQTVYPIYACLSFCSNMKIKTISAAKFTIIGSKQIMDKIFKNKRYFKVNIFIFTLVLKCWTFIKLYAQPMDTNNSVVKAKGGGSVGWVQGGKGAGEMGDICNSVNNKKKNFRLKLKTCYITFI